MTDLATAHLATTYLGNLAQSPQLAQQLSTLAYLEVTLEPRDRSKGRIYTQTAQGETVGITKDRHWSLAEGDVFQTTDGDFLLIHLKPQRVMTLSFSPSVLTQTLNHPLALIQLGHTLGNRHWPIVIEADKIFVQIGDDHDVIESTLQGFEIPGLEIAYELRSPTHPLNFSAHHPHE